MLPPLAHLSNAAGAPPNVRLGVDEDRRASWVAIGNSLCRKAVDEMLGGRKSVRFALPKREARGTTCKLKRSSAGQCLSMRAIEAAFCHEPHPLSGYHRGL